MFSLLSNADAHGQVAHLYHLAQQKLRYGIVKNRLRNKQKRLYFDLKIANFLQRLKDDLQWLEANPRVDFQNFTKMIHHCHSNGNNFLSVWRCGSYFNSSSPSISHFFQQVLYRKCGSTPVHGAEVPNSGCNVTFSNLFRKPHTVIKHSLFSEF